MRNTSNRPVYIPQKCVKFFAKKYTVSL